MIRKTILESVPVPSIGTSPRPVPEAPAGLGRSGPRAASGHVPPFPGISSGGDGPSAPVPVQPLHSAPMR